MRLSVVVPLFEEADNVAPLVGELLAVLSSRDGCTNDEEPSFGIVLVDDASTDRTWEAVEDARSRDERVVAVRHRVRCGQSAAISSGYRHSRGEVVVTMDGDLQHDPRDTAKLVHALEGSIACACGFRPRRNDGFVKKASSRLENAFRNAITGDHVTDAGCTLRAVRRAALAELPVFNGLHRFLPTVLRFQGFECVEVPVNHRQRVRGVTKYGVGNRLWRGIRDCFAMRWYRRRAVLAARVDPPSATEIRVPDGSAPVAVGRT